MSDEGGKRTLASGQNGLWSVTIHEPCDRRAKGFNLRVIGKERASNSVARAIVLKVVGNLNLNAEVACLVRRNKLNPKNNVFALLHAVAPLCHYWP